MKKRSLKEMMGGMIGPMTAIAKAMSRNHRIRIEPSGFECSTDGQVIRYPFNADYLQEADQKVLHGILDHEVAHIDEERSHADAGVEQPLAVMRRQPSKRHSMFLNVFEDIRIESKKSAEFPGVAENLAAANKHSTELFQKRHGSDMARANFWHTIGSAIILKARGEDISWLPSNFKPFLDVVADEVAASNWPECRWVTDAEHLAHSAIRKIEELAEDVKEEQEKREEEKHSEDSGDGEGDIEDTNGSGEGDEKRDESAAGDDGDDEEDDGAGGEDESDEDAEGATGESKSKGESTDESEGSESGSDGSEESKLSDMDDKELEDTGKAAECALGEDSDVADIMNESKGEMMEQAKGEADASGRYVPCPDAMRADRETRPIGDLADVDRCKDRVQKQISTLRAKLLAVVRSRAASAIIVDQEEGEIDDAALSSVPSGNRRVFRNERPGEVLDTAISVLIDLSGSMGCGDTEGSKSWYVKHMSIALAETFDALGVPFEMIGFHNGRGYGASSLEHRSSHSYSRLEAFEFRVFKAFDERLRKTRHRLSNITGGGNNADGEAVLFISKRLVMRPESRKILFVLSDGQPAAHGNRLKLRQHLKDSVAAVTKAGIEVLGIGAKCPRIADFYNKDTGASHVIIDDLDTLAVEVYKLMRARLLQRRKKVA